MDDDILELTSSDSEHDVFGLQALAREREQRGVTTRSRGGSSVVEVDENNEHGTHNQNGKKNNGINAIKAVKGGQAGKRKAPKMNAKAPIPNDIIDLTDSEAELVPRTRSRSKKLPSNAVAGPSHPQELYPPQRRKRGTQPVENHVAGPSGSNATENAGLQVQDHQPLAGPSNGIHQAQFSTPPRKRKTPLFLEDPDEKDEDLPNLFAGFEFPEDERAAKKNRVYMNNHFDINYDDPFAYPDEDIPQQNGMDFAQPDQHEMNQILAWEGFGPDVLYGPDLRNDDQDEIDRMALADVLQLPQQYLPPGQQLHLPPQPAPEAVAPAPAPSQPAQPVQPPPEQPAPAAPPSKDAVIAQVLEIVPDVCPNHLSGLIDRNIGQFGDRTSELVIGMLFEDPNYPKAERVPRGVKRGAEGDGNGGGEPGGSDVKRRKVDYRSVDREVPGRGYSDLALATLQLYFAHIPRKYLYHQLKAHKLLYAPTYLALLAEERRYQEQPNRRKAYDSRTYANKKSTAKAKGKGKGKANARQGAGQGAEGEAEEEDDDVPPVVAQIQTGVDVQAKFDEELVWLEGYLASGGDDFADGDANGQGQEEGEGERQGQVVDKGKGKEKAVDVDEQVDGEGEAEIECGCCFGDYPFSEMVQCPEAHLFCKNCLTTYASTQLSSLSCNINCMSSNPTCSLPFPPSELRRALPDNLLKLYDRVTQQAEIANAGLEGLEECPFCEWKCVMEMSVEQDKLFRCGNEDGGCGVVSCRICKKLDHLPKSCKEVEEDKVLDGRHAIEEAMTAALMRNCPQCKKAFIKEQGCNKMTCPHCRTLSCYICRQIIKGYDHFDQQPGQPGTSKKKSNKCSLWDKVEERHAEEVKAAHDIAMAKYREEHPDVETDALKVDLPKGPPRPPPPVPVAAPARGARPHARRGRAAAMAAHAAAYHHVHNRPIPVPPPPLVVPPAPVRPPGRRVARQPAQVRGQAPAAPLPLDPFRALHQYHVPAGHNLNIQLGAMGDVRGYVNMQQVAANNPGVAHMIHEPAPIPHNHQFMFGQGAGVLTPEMQQRLAHNRELLLQERQQALVQQEQQRQQRAAEERRWQLEQVEAQRMQAEMRRRMEQNQQQLDAAAAADRVRQSARLRAQQQQHQMQMLNQRMQPQGQMAMPMLNQRIQPQGQVQMQMPMMQMQMQYGGNQNMGQGAHVQANVHIHQPVPMVPLPGRMTRAQAAAAAALAQGDPQNGQGRM